MITVILYVIFSFFLDGIISNMVPSTLVNPGVLKTIYSIISIVVIYQYFDNYKKYLGILIMLGIFIDIVYTNTFILNIVVLLIIYFVLSFLDYHIQTNIVTISIKSLVCLYVYYFITYILLNLSNYHQYPISLLLKICLSSIISTIIYSTMSYVILNRLNIKKIK